MVKLQFKQNPSQCVTEDFLQSVRRPKGHHCQPQLCPSHASPQKISFCTHHQQEQPPASLQLLQERRGLEHSEEGHLEVSFPERCAVCPGGPLPWPGSCSSAQAWTRWGPGASNLLLTETASRDHSCHGDTQSGRAGGGPALEDELQNHSVTPPSGDEQEPWLTGAQRPSRSAGLMAQRKKWETDRESALPRWRQV